MGPIVFILSIKPTKPNYLISPLVNLIRKSCFPFLLHDSHEKNGYNWLKAQLHCKPNKLPIQAHIILSPFSQCIFLALKAQLTYYLGPKTLVTSCISIRNNIGTPRPTNDAEIQVRHHTGQTSEFRSTTKIH